MHNTRVFVFSGVVFVMHGDFRQYILMRPPQSGLPLHFYALYIDCMQSDAELSTELKEEKIAMPNYTSIRVTKETVALLKERGKKGESYDAIIRKLLEKRRR